MIFILFYLISVFVTRKWMQNAYSKGGVWERLTPDSTDTFTVLCPGANLITLLAHMLIEGSWNGKKYVKSKNTFTKMFFNIKKDRI